MEDAYYLLGTVLQEQGDLNGAIVNFSKALELKPDFEMVYGDLFYALFQNGQNSLAEDIIKKGYPFIRLSQSFTTISVTYMQKKENLIRQSAVFTEHCHYSRVMSKRAAT